MVYRAEITRRDNGAVEYYTGLTGGTFKKRWQQHLTDIRKYNPDDGSHGKRMSKYVGNLEASNILYILEYLTESSDLQPHHQVL